MTLGVNGNNSDKLPDNLTTSDKIKPYAGGSLQIKTFPNDTQRDFVWRGLYEHAKSAGLSHEECVKFADQWTIDKLQYQENGKTLEYTEKEFVELRKKGITNFDLNEGSPILTDLRKRQIFFANVQKSIQNPNTPSISAPNYTESEKAVKWMTDSIQSITETETEVGKQFNRLSVSSLRLMGSLQELQNKATESINDMIRDVAPDSVDEFLDNADKMNRENAQALKNANTIVTNNDRAEDLYLAKEGIKRPVAEDLHRKLMYFPEAIPNAVDSAIKGDFKDDDGSYSDQVGKIIGGLNPAGDVRDITANAKRVIDGEKGSGIKLGAAIIGAIPGGGDVAKPIIKEVAEEITEKTVKEVSTETAEKVVKEELKDVPTESVELSVKDSNKLIGIEYKEVEIIDSKGQSLGEFDKIERGLFVEEKSAKGLNTLHPKTGKPVQTPENWAQKQIYEKSVTRIENLRNVATATRKTVNGSKDIPTLEDIKDIKSLEFRVDSDTSELRKAVEKSIEDLSQKYPDWKFTATFGK